MTEPQLTHQILQSLDCQRRDSPAPITAGHIASAAGLLYYATWPAQEGYPSGKSESEIRQMAIDLIAKCMRFVLERAHDPIP